LDACIDAIQQIKDHIAEQVSQLQRKLAKKQRALDSPDKPKDLSMMGLGVSLRDCSLELKRYEAFQTSRMIECLQAKAAQMDANDKLLATEIEAVVAAGLKR